MVVEWEVRKSLNPLFNSYAENQPEGSIILSYLDDQDRQVGVGVAREFDADEASHPGWYVSSVRVVPEWQAQGVGYALVSELLRRIPVAPVYLIRPAAEGRAFQGGFGFVAVDSPYRLKGFSDKLQLFVAENPDPDWVR